MLGTRGGRARRVAVRPEAAHGALPPLPLSLVLAVADHLPADDKLRLALVGPAFRAVADERWLYRDVRLGDGSGVGRASDSLLRAVSAKARGTMRTLDVSGLVGGYTSVVSVDAMVAVCAANADTLEAVDARCREELHDMRRSYLGNRDVARLLASVPRLCRLDTDINLFVLRFNDAASVVALITALAAQPSLTQLHLSNAPLHAAVTLEAVTGFAVERRLSAVRLAHCALGVGSMPALVRLLEQGTGLAGLWIDNNGVGLHFSAAFRAALRACPLTWLKLFRCRLFDDPGGLALLAAATAHPVLRHISVLGNWAADDARPAVSAALGALVGANAPALTSLDVSWCNLGDEGLRPLVDVLPGNSELRSLSCDRNGVSRPFAASLLAAVRANTSLRTLVAVDPVGVNGAQQQAPHPELVEAEALVATRAAAAAAAAAAQA